MFDVATTIGFDLHMFESVVLLSAKILGILGFDFLVSTLLLRKKLKSNQSEISAACMKTA